MLTRTHSTSLTLADRFPGGHRAAMPVDLESGVGHSSAAVLADPSAGDERRIRTRAKNPQESATILRLRFICLDAARLYTRRPLDCHSSLIPSRASLMRVAPMRLLRIPEPSTIPISF